MEMWREVPGYGGWYECSDGGRVRSWRSRGYGVGRRLPQPVILKPEVSKGYSRVQLSLGGQVKHALIHRLVLLTFTGEAPVGKPLGCHVNGDPMDNRPQNLRWGSHADNAADARVHGTLPVGMCHHAAKLSERDVLEMRAEYAAGRATQAQLGRRYGVRQDTVSDIVRGVTWAHLPVHKGKREDG